MTTVGAGVNWAGNYEYRARTVIANFPFGPAVDHPLFDRDRTLKHDRMVLSARFSDASFRGTFGPLRFLRALGLAFRLAFGPRLGAFGARGFAGSGAVVGLVGGKSRHRNGCEKDEKKTVTHGTFP